MELLSKILDWTIQPIGDVLVRQVGYIIRCRTNIENLKARVEELKAARMAKENEVADAEQKGQKIQPDVRLWLETAIKITAETEDQVLKDEVQATLKCLHGFCPNLTVRRRLSKKSKELAEEAAKHHEKKGLISGVSSGFHRKEVWGVTTGDYQPFQSRMSIVNRMLDSLKNSNIQRIGVFGIGGVGKTTLVKEVYKHVLEGDKLFDDVVILLDVKKEPNLEVTQKKIVEQLGMEINLPDETVGGRASRLCGRIQGKKILVILDDVQEKIDLEVIGLPRLPTCKILLTCRTRLSLNEMRVDDEFQLDLLSTEETWNLFENMVGDIVKHKGSIRDKAMEVAEKCGGLPLLVTTVASACKGKNKLGEWKDTLRRLKGFPKEGMTEQAYRTLEWSYEQLEEKELQPLFLLSGILVQQNHVFVEDMLRYGVGLGLFKDVDTLGEARNALDTLLGKLKDSCLVLDGDSDDKVRMHDLVCHVANSIACRDHHMFSIEYGCEFKDWPKEDDLKKCTRISLIHEHIPTLPEVPMECPVLEMFHLRHACVLSTIQIPSNFFSKMPRLRVMGLINLGTRSLPSYLQYLKELKTLRLENCLLGDISFLGQLSKLEILSFSRSYFRELPKQIGQLTCLRLLDLSDCRWLEVIPPAIISSLTMLEDLRMRNSFKAWGVGGEGSNASLSELKHLSRLSSLEIHIPYVDFLPANLFSNKQLERFNICIGVVDNESSIVRKRWMLGKRPPRATTLNTLTLKLTKTVKELDEGLKSVVKGCEGLFLNEEEADIVHQLNIQDLENVKHLELQNNISLTDLSRKVFPNSLVTLSLFRCEKLKFLFSVSVAKSLVQLTKLSVYACKLLQEIVSSTKDSEEETSSKLAQNSFRRLKVVEVVRCQNLTSLFPPNVVGRLNALESLVIEDCKSLEVAFKLPERNNDKETHGGTSFPDIDHDRLKSCCFQNLGSVTISRCESLKDIVPRARGRHQDTHVSVKDSDDIKEIVGAEDDQELVEKTPPTFVFPKVTSMELTELPQLSCINASQWPLLKQLGVELCGEARIFAAEYCHIDKKHEMEPLLTSHKPLFLTDKDSFLNLEDLSLEDMEIWNGQSPANRLVFGKLKSITFGQNCVPFSKQASLLFLQRLQNLEKLQLQLNSCLDISVNRETSTSKSHGEEVHDDAVWTLCRVRFLSICGLMNLGNENHGSLLFPNLETLGVKYCYSIKNIESSAICFRNLTTLDVFSCDGLEYLTSYSVAKSLVQLKTLRVSRCERIVVIVSSNGDDAAAGNEIVFSSLQHLEFFRLPSLQGFCSGNCTVKFPSSPTLKVEHCGRMKWKISPDGVLLPEKEAQEKGEQAGDVETAQTSSDILSNEAAS